LDTVQFRPYAASKILEKVENQNIWNY
jgi:hypothetical protein